MVRLVLILLGIDYLRKRWRALLAIGLASVAAGLVVFIDALDGVHYFPLRIFAVLLFIEGLATLAVAWTGVGGQRILRYAKGLAFAGAALLVLAGHRHGNFILSMIFGTLFLADGLLQATSAAVVRYRRWRMALVGGVIEIAIAIFFYQPYPTHYVGTVPYCIGLALIFGGWNVMVVASRVRRMRINPGFAGGAQAAATPNAPPAASTDAQAGTTTAPRPTPSPLPRRFEWDGPPEPDEPALTVHIWTPTGTAKARAQRHLIIDRYIAAVDVNGVISTGHAALETPEGIYISLYPGVEIDRSPEEFGRLLRATPENNVPGLFQPDYRTEATAWCESTRKVRIRNYDPERLRVFWERYRQDTTYNLTHRNCSSSVSRALEAAIEGAVGQPHGQDRGWRALLRVLTTPELWVAAQIRKRAATMAWTPGLTLDYARALSMLVDPRPYGWVKMARIALRTMARSRRRWHDEDKQAPGNP